MTLTVRYEFRSLGIRSNNWGWSDEGFRDQGCGWFNSAMRKLQNFHLSVFIGGFLIASEDTNSSTGGHEAIRLPSIQP